MRAVIQRVSKSQVDVNGETIGSIGKGLLVLLGVEKGDGKSDFDYVLGKTLGLRIFEDDDGKMNLSATQVGAELLVISQFTLLGDVRKGRRPAFTAAEDPSIAEPTYLRFVEAARASGLKVQTGIFGADMKVHLLNDGPVTILLDSKKTF
ncbi:D-aminoacyl-tRNA deacylase [Mariniblastus fucicola]|uniref:D-aminoacyl-tRNA deacylase n=1 Tax=Mariniblastus fucicola TaxID=980251 RepID=A0A5B9PG02_9BACT|nr:D-aminoacyl-tRNA deacylase [Mariniblastus fucicola]QEG24150.1 D-tyrosyl-tRNA(Tyr) deacylase [Mariniblastus fucicola]